jgi:hypothetical protein
VLGRTLVYFNCKILPILSGIAEVNPNARVIIELLRPPTAAECQAQGLVGASAVKASTARAHSSALDTRARTGALQLFKALQPHLGAKAARVSDHTLSSALGLGG